ncbi:MAG: arginine--tRNA ligase [Candidatus Anstonellales archaeon]
MKKEVEDKISKLISEATGISSQDALRTLETPKNNFGDVASTVSFQVAKRYGGKKPSEVAKEIEGNIGKDEWILKVEAVGPYLNFFLSDEFYSYACARVIEMGERFGKERKDGGKILLEFPSVNPNKPWHVGHLRNAILGDCVGRLLEFVGRKVERQDYIDDLGLQVAESLWGYLNLERESVGKFDHWIGKQYVEVEKRMDSEKVKEEVRALLKKMETGDKEISALHQEMVETCVRAQYETAIGMGVYHDVLIKESDIVSTIYKEGIELLLKSKSVVYEREGQNAGCIVARIRGEEFEGMKNPDVVLVRSDGTATYTAKDVIFHLWKFGKLKGRLKYRKFISQPNGKDCFISAQDGIEMEFGKADQCINVIGMEQTYQQKVVKEILRSLGYEKEAEALRHLSYEHAYLPSGRFSGREGTWIGYTADELIEEGIRRAREKVVRKMSEEEKEKVAREVAIGAIRFSLVSKSPEKKIVFDWDKALSLEGDSAPYLQYAYARICGIISKGGGLKTEVKRKIAYRYTPEEKNLLKVILKFPEILEEAARELWPHRICEYALDIASAFNKFYTTSPVIKATGDEKEARIRILIASRNCIKNTLSLLGIAALEEM